MNIQLLKAADFNEKLHDQGVDIAVTIQRICRVTRDEAKVRDVLKLVWNETEKTGGILVRIAKENAKLFEFEKILEKDYEE
jgi:hypothetical protein